MEPRGRISAACLLLLLTAPVCMPSSGEACTLSSGGQGPRGCGGCPCAKARTMTALSVPPAEIAPVLTRLDVAMDQHKASSEQDYDVAGKPVRFRRPFVTVTYAQCLDGSIADKQSRPLAISCHEAMVMTHFLRARHRAILVGVQTVINDDPSLTVRLCKGENPRPVILDSSLRTPLTSKLVSSGTCVRPLVVCAEDAGASLDRSRAAALEEQGCSVLECCQGKDKRVDLGSLLYELAQRGVESVMVEGGSTVLSAFLSSNFVDLVIVTLSPAYVGGLPCFRPPLTSTSGHASGGTGDEHPSAEDEPAEVPFLKDLGTLMVGDDIVIFGAHSSKLL